MKLKLVIEEMPPLLNELVRNLKETGDDTTFVDWMNEDATLYFLNDDWALLEYDESEGKAVFVTETKNPEGSET